MSKRVFTEEEKGLIHRTMMKDNDGKLASKDDLALFVQTCERTGLDPFARQIMPSSRSSQKNGSWVVSWTYLVTIDGLRKIAVDTGEYVGQDGPWWCGQDGVWKEIWTDPKNPCFAAKVVAHRKGFLSGLSGIAKYASYVQKKKDGQPNNVWSNLGDHMTAKCAEALALRRAFPNEMAGLYTANEMAGLYTADEMAQAGYEVPEEPKAVRVETNPTPEPTVTKNPDDKLRPQDPEPGQWSIDAQEQFAGLMDRFYSVFKAAGKLDIHADHAAKWRKRMASETPETVIPALSKVVLTLEKNSTAAAPAA